jgi:uncharacterized RDD family membrane protein YckC
MTIAERYVNQVVGKLPGALRTQIATDLRSHIAERVEHGQSIDEALHQLGDPTALAESYLAAVALVTAPFWRRAVAKIIDLLMLGASIAAITWVTFYLVRPPAAQTLDNVELSVLVLSAWGILFGGYSLIVEYLFGQTLGKRICGLRVVSESGTRISLGQSFVRQLPWFLQIFWIDGLVALFTEKHQRAVELISKTRVVVA